MAYPVFEKLFVLHTDASKDGLGVVLYQYQNDILRVVAYGSHSLTPAEKNYHLHSEKLEFWCVSGRSVISFEIISTRHQVLNCTLITTR